MNSIRGKRAILYRRVSTAEQRKVGHSLGYQRDALHRFCDSNGIDVAREFQEDYSAKKLRESSSISGFRAFRKSEST